MKLNTNGGRLSRRNLLLCALAAVILIGSAFADEGQSKVPANSVTSPWKNAVDADQAEPFWGEHQGGIVTKPQHFTYFAAFDLVTTRREDVIKLLQAWTKAADRMGRGETAQPLESGLQVAVMPIAPQGEEDGAPDPSTMPADTGEVIGMPPSRLTITIGFGAGLFIKDGKDRYGLASRRPEALVDMPSFGAIDQMAEERTGGDLSVQASAEDPQIAFHAVRQLARIAQGVAQIRWVQTGYRPMKEDRHLLGFSAEEKDPTMNAPEAKSVWVGEEGPEWMRGGSYLVARRIRFALEHWDQMPVAYQEKAIGGIKFPGPPVDKNQSDDTGMQDDSSRHLEVVAHGKDTILRRSYSYNDGVNFISERWPPWRQGLEYDAGMFFICYQRDPRTGFIAIFGEMAKRDFKLNQFWTHVGGGLFAIPRGPKQDEYVGQPLFESR
jgi:deferrochelatase/peroxidase EfeB